MVVTVSGKLWVSLCLKLRAVCLKFRPTTKAEFRDKKPCACLDLGIAFFGVLIA